MNGHTPGAWRYCRNVDETFSVFPEESYIDESFSEVVIAEVFTDKVSDPEANARIIAASPEMYIALSGAVEALRATEVFMCGQGLNMVGENTIASITKLRYNIFTIKNFEHYSASFSL